MTFAVTNDPISRGRKGFQRELWRNVVEQSTLSPLFYGTAECNSHRVVTTNHVIITFMPLQGRVMT